MKSKQSSWSYLYWWWGEYRSRYEYAHRSINYKQLKPLSPGRHADHILHNIIDYQDFMNTMMIPNLLFNFNQRNNSIRLIIYRIRFNILGINNRINYSAINHRLFHDLIQVKHYKITHRIQWRRRNRSLFSGRRRIRIFGKIKIKIWFEPSDQDPINFEFSNLSPADPLIITENYRYLD